MAEITRKRTGELLQKLFAILLASPEGLPAGKALERLAESVTLTAHEAGIYESSGSRRFEKIVRFATVDCVKAGWLVKDKGIWAVTDEGKTALQTFPDPDAFYREATRLYRAWKAAQPGKPEIIAASDNEIADTADESVAVTFEEAEEQSWAEIERYIHKMGGYDFQALVADLLRGMGYHVSWEAPRGKDGGIDIIAYIDPLGAQTPRFKVQVKQRADRVDTDELRSFIAIVNDDEVGLYVSAGGFTRDAEAFARQNTRCKITLVDLARFVALWIKYYDKLPDTARRRLPLTPIHFLTPEV